MTEFGMWTLALSCAFFLCIHLMISGTVLKEQIIASIGPIAYYIIFSLFSIFGLIWMSTSFAASVSDEQNILFWPRPPLWLKAVGFAINFIAFNLFVLGLLSPSPTGLKALTKPPVKPVYGIIRVSRHPVLAGIGLFCIAHMILNGNMAAWIFFGSLLMLCALGANNIDHKRSQTMGEAYSGIKHRTSIIPFVAIFAGRTPFMPSEVGIIRLMLSVSLFTLTVVLHEVLFMHPAL
jgi:uncharacterized membrane protein